jgi:hypothetical protein
MKETIVLSPKDVAKAVQDWLKKKIGTGGPDWVVSVGAKFESCGFGASERDKPIAEISASRERT